MQVKAKLNNLRIAPRKVRLTADLVRGLELFEAINQLDSVVKGANVPMKKLLMSAMANAENNFGIDRNNLYISEIIVNEGPTLKRWMPRAFGRASMILKRTSKINLVLDEIEEGKNRKSKEQLEKERKAREQARKKEEKERAEQEKGEENQVEKKISKENENVHDNKQNIKDQKGKWSSKIFRRKSM